MKAKRFKEIINSTDDDMDIFIRNSINPCGNIQELDQVEVSPYTFFGMEIPCLILNTSSSKKIETDKNDEIIDFIGDKKIKNNNEPLNEIVPVNEPPETNQKWNVFAKNKPLNEGWYQCTVEVPNQQRYVMNLYWYPSTGKFIDNIRQNVCDVYDVIGYSGKKLYDIGQDRTDSVIAWTDQLEPYMEGFVNEASEEYQDRLKPSAPEYYITPPKEGWYYCSFTVSDNNMCEIPPVILHWDGSDWIEQVEEVHGWHAMIKPISTDIIQLKDHIIWSKLPDPRYANDTLKYILKYLHIK